MVESRAAQRSRRVRRAVFYAGVALCHGVEPELADDPEITGAFVDAVRRHRIAPLAHVRLRETRPRIAVPLRGDRDHAIATHLKATILLDSLNQVLGDVPWATFKGPVLSEHAHPIPALRTYNDVDVLVSPHRLGETCDRLLETGWSVADYRDMLLNPDTPGELHWLSPNGLIVDLHWSMVNMAATRRYFRLVTDDVLDSRVEVPLGLSTTWTLAPADTLVHVCLHAALTGAHRLLLILDADQVARSIHDWAAVADRATHCDAAAAVALVLARSRTLLCTPIPDDFDSRLRTSAAFRVVTRAADRLLPVASLRHDASLPKLIARSVRGRGMSTLAVAGRRGLRGVSHRMRLSAGYRPPPKRQRADVEDVREYVRAVEVEARSTAAVTRSW